MSLSVLSTALPPGSGSDGIAVARLGSLGAVEDKIDQVAEETAALAGACPLLSWPLPRLSLSRSREHAGCGRDGIGPKRI